MFTSISKTKLSRNTSIIIGLMLLSFFISACGGSAGNSSSFNQTSSQGWQENQFVSASKFANKCAAPRSGIDPYTGKNYADTKGTFLDENNFLRSWSNDTYLWFNEIVDKDPNNYTTPDYFNLLKTNQLTASGKQKDRFHFTYNSADWYSFSNNGSSSGYGIQIAWISSDIPRNLVIAFVEPTSPAKTAGVTRGAKIISVDGVDMINAGDTASVNTLNAGLFPAKANESHVFVLQDAGASTTHSVTLVSADVTETPVPVTKTISTAMGSVGYVLFNDHIKTAEIQLRDAVQQFKTAGVQDLVLDLRYNGGGYLSIANELAYMIAGATVTNGKTFEKTTFNSKYQTKDFWGDAITPDLFLTKLSTDQSSLPTLNLSRVFVITSGDTCSASESVINGLRGVGVQVIQIGSKTCGKPYGFYPQDNCGTTYFSIQFKGVNDKGFGEYSDGFVPSDVDNNMDNVKGCILGDDLTKELGDAAEKNLATALNYRLNNSCTLPTSNSVNGLQKSQFEDPLADVHATLNKPDIQMNRYREK